MWHEWNAAAFGARTIREIPCVRNLIDRGIPAVEAEWQPLLGPLGVTATLSGVMCHGFPRVTYPGLPLTRTRIPKSCELGDMMIVHDHVPDPVAHPNIKERRAVIVQAKVFDYGKVGSGDAIQLELYQSWPRFTYLQWPNGMEALTKLLETNAGIPRGTVGAFERDIKIDAASGHRKTRSAVDAGARYGMIDAAYGSWVWPHPVPWYWRRGCRNPWRMCRANAPNLYHYPGGLSLGQYLSRLVVGRVGRIVPFPGWPSGLARADHWSLMVEELLSLRPMPPSATATTAAASAVMPSGPSNALALMTRHGPSGIPGNPNGGRGGDGDGGFAIILLRTSGGPSSIG